MSTAEAKVSQDGRWKSKLGDKAEGGREVVPCSIIPGLSLTLRVKTEVLTTAPKAPPCSPDPRRPDSNTPTLMRHG